MIGMMIGFSMVLQCMKMSVLMFSRKSWPDESTSSVSISHQDPSGTVFMPTLDSDPNSWSASLVGGFGGASTHGQSNFDRLFQAGKMAPSFRGNVFLYVYV